MPKSLIKNMVVQMNSFNLIVIVALETMGYFQIVERLNIADIRITLMEKDLSENAILDKMVKE